MQVKNKISRYHPGRADFELDELLDSHRDPQTREQHSSMKPIGISWADKNQEFIIFDPNYKAPIRILVPVSESPHRNVEYLLTEYLKRRIGTPNFDLGRIACLKTREGFINFDFLLTRNEVPLSLFPSSIVLVPYESELCKGMNINSFHLITIAGLGSYGRVVVVRKKDTGKIYAMKIIRKDRLMKNHKESYLFEEKMIMTEIDHPFVVRLV